MAVRPAFISPSPARLLSPCKVSTRSSFVLSLATSRVAFPSRTRFARFTTWFHCSRLSRAKAFTEAMHPGSESHHLKILFLHFL